MTSHPPLLLENASKAFNGRPAVKDFSMAVKPGEILGFLGPNGAGKSTSLRMALGVLEPDSGKALLFGDAPKISHLRRVGFLPEERGLYRKMSARSTIAHFACLKGMKRSDALKKADELLERFGLAHARKSRISRLSKGMAQKVQILAALAHDPELIVLDEPFSGLDPVNQHDLEALIREKHAQGATILFSTHVMEHAERLCDRLVVIGKGEKKFDGGLDHALALAPAQAQLATRPGFDLIQALTPKGFAVEPASQSENEMSWSVTTPPGGSAQDVLRAAIEANAPILSFIPHQPRLRDIFVSLVDEPDAKETE